MRKFEALVLLSVLSCLLLIVPAAAKAAVVADAELSITPLSPEAHTETKVGIANPSLVAPGSTIRWFVDGVELTNALNYREISLITKAPGQESVAEAIVSAPGRQEQRFVARIQPIRLDLIVGADSYVPNFYQGRALPSSGSEISAQVFVFGDSGGPYTYQWRVNSRPHTTTIGGTSNQITFRSDLEFEMVVEVMVYDQRGTLVGQKREVIELAEPEILFYEANPLQGLLPNALQSPYFFIADEITINAAPYYFAKPLSELSIDWEIDNQDTLSDANPLQLTLLKTRESGRAQIDVRVMNTNNYETASGDFEVTF